MSQIFLLKLKKYISFFVVALLIATITGMFYPPAKEAKAAILLVQKKTASGTTSASVTWDSPTTAGNLLVAVVHNQASGSGENISAPSGWAYATSADFGTYGSLRIYYKEGAPSQSSTGNFTSSGGDTLEVAVAEYSGIATSSSLDQVRGQVSPSPSTAINSGSTLATSQADELVIIGVGSNSNVIFSGATNSFTIQQTLSQTGFLDRIVSSIGTYGTHVTQSSSVSWGTVTATFKASSGGGGGNTAPVMSNTPSDNGSSVGSPTEAGNNVNFTIIASDTELDKYYLAICKSNSILAGSNGSAPSCPGGSWAISGAADSGSQASVAYTTSASDVGNKTWYAFVCDNNSNSSCSDSSQGLLSNGSPFVVAVVDDDLPPSNPTGIRVSISTIGGDNTFNFTTTGSGYANFSVTTLNSSASDTQNGLSPGTYSLQQGLPQGWSQDSFTCDNGTPDAILVVNQQITNCSVINSTTNPPPTIDSISPTGASINATQVVITVTGSNFMPSSVIKFNGNNLTTTFISSTKLTATIQASELSSACMFDVVVFNPSPGGGTSGPVTFTISDDPPIITSIDPSSRPFGLGEFTLTVNGQNFTKDSIVKFNGQSQTTTYLSSTRLTAKILPSYISRIGRFQVLVLNSVADCTVVPPEPTTVNPLPTTTSISPSSVNAGSQGFVLTVNGTNFIPNSQVRLNSQNRVTTYVSSTKLTALIASSDLINAVSYNVAVFNQAPGGGTSNAQVLSVNSTNPSPTITSISPSSVSTGSQGFDLTITGTNFVNNSKGKFNNQHRTTTYVSATQLTLQILDSDLTFGGLYDILVDNSSSGGGVSNPKPLSISSPMPTITSISPTSANLNGSYVILTINGTDFIKSSKVKYNNSDKATTYVSDTKLRIIVTETDLQTAGSFDVVVINPSPGGGTSNIKVFTVGSGGESEGNPSPIITSISPASAITGSAGFELTITGSNFIANSQAKFNNQNRSTTFVSSTSLKAQILSSDISTAGSYNITVANPSPGGGTSNVKVLTVSSGGGNPAPTITSISPSSVTVGSSGFTLTVNGTNFVGSGGSTVMFNGSSRTTTFISSTKLNATIPASDLANTGTFSIKVSNSDGNSSNSVNFTVSNINWTARDSSRDWYAVAMSSDGTKQTAVVDNGGQIYTSSDSGVNWTARGPSTNWQDIAMSSDGTKQTAVPNGGQIYTSSDSGVTWTARNPSFTWISVAMSSDGVNQTAVAGGGKIYTSSNSGVTWTARDSSRHWYGVDMSSDGTKQTAVVYGGQIYTSSDSGVTWTARDSSRNWSDVAMSSDGTKQTALSDGQMYTSSDSGVTWTAGDSSRNWHNITMSSDGTKQSALGYVGSNNLIYTSSDSGLTWTAMDSVRHWQDIAMSSDGTKQTAVVGEGRIYTYSN